MRAKGRILVMGLLAVVGAASLYASSGETRAGVPLTTVSISPAEQTVSAGDDVVIDVMIADVSEPDGLGSYEFILNFAPNVLEFDSFSDGSFLSSTDRDVTCLPVRLDVDGDTVEDPGFVRVACVTLGASPAGPTGGGVLATMTFSTSCAEQSFILFERATLGDLLGEDIAADTVGGAVTVTGGSPCPPPAPVGDVTCEGEITSVDAALILQLDAGLVPSLACLDNADTNADGENNAIDAALILQFVAGLIATLPP